MFIWLYPSLPVQLSFILERSVGSRKRGPVCPEPRLLSSTKHSAGFKGECSLGSQVLISPQTDMLLNSLKCQKRWVYLSCWSSWLHMASWASTYMTQQSPTVHHLPSGRGVEYVKRITYWIWCWDWWVKQSMVYFSLYLSGEGWLNMRSTPFTLTQLCTVTPARCNGSQV